MTPIVPDWRIIYKKERDFMQLTEEELDNLEKKISELAYLNCKQILFLFTIRLRCDRFLAESLQRAYL